MGKELLPLAKKTLESKLYDKVKAIYDGLMEEWNMPTFVLAPNADVINKIAMEQAEMAAEEFLDNYDDAKEDNLPDLVDEYVEENYDADFLYNAVERKLDMDKIRKDLVDDVLLFLANTEPYQDVPRTFWSSYLTKVDNVKELVKYDSEDGIHDFVEKYAPDWQEVANENKD